MDPNRGETVYETKPVGNVPNAYDSVLKLDNVRTEHYETRFRYNQGILLLFVSISIIKFKFDVLEMFIPYYSK